MMMMIFRVMHFNSTSMVIQYARYFCKKERLIVPIKLFFHKYILYHFYVNVIDTLHMALIFLYGLHFYVF